MTTQSRVLPKLLLLTIVISQAPPAIAADAAVVEQGGAVFQHLCAPCHGTGADANGMPVLPGSYSLQLKYNGAKPAFLEQRSDLPAAVIKTFVRHGIASMPPFRKSEVTDQEIDAIAAYLAQAAKKPIKTK